MRWASFLAAVCIAAGVAAGATAATPPPLRERVMRTSELGGLVVPGRPRLVTSVPEWITGDPTGEWTTGDPRSLALAGFVRGLRERYGPKADNGMSALSSVAEFRTAAGARDEVASEVGSAHPPAPTYVAFPVAGIPGAHGFKQEGPGIVVYFVMFNDGRFQYEIGFGGSPWADHRHGPAIKAQAIAAAQALYRRVHGRPVGVAAADGGRTKLVGSWNRNVRDGSALGASHRPLWSIRFGTERVATIYGPVGAHVPGARDTFTVAYRATASGRLVMPAGSGCATVGIYRWSLTGDALRISKATDVCLGRIAVLRGVWTRTQMIRRTVAPHP